MPGCMFVYFLAVCFFVLFICSAFCWFVDCLPVCCFAGLHALVVCWAVGHSNAQVPLNSGMCFLPIFDM